MTSLTAKSARNRGNPEARFHDSYIPEPNSGCWLWLGRPIMPKGYGTITVDDRQLLAHRYSWVLHHGAIESGLFVMHRCDNPACVNPDHLRLGSHRDNTDDMLAKSRQARGQQIKISKLTPEQVIEIRRSPFGSWKLAKMYGVSRPSIRAVKRGETWKHIPNPTEAVE